MDVDGGHDGAEKDELDMHFNEIGAIAKSSGGLVANAAKLAVKTGVEVAMSV